LLSTRGFSAAEVETNYRRAHDLSENLGDVPPAVLYGIWAVYLVRSDRDRTARMANTFEKLLSTSDDQSVLLMALAALGVRGFFTARYDEARSYFARARALCDEDQPLEHAMLLQNVHGFEGYLYPFVYLAWCDAVHGFAERALTTWSRALQLAEAINQPYGLAMTLCFGASIAHDLGEVDLTHQIATREIAIALEGGFAFWLATGNVMLGWAEAKKGAPEAGIPRIESGLTLLENIGGFVTLPYYKGALAEAYLLAGRAEDALRTIDQAIAFTEDKLSSHYLPTAYNLRADALLAQGDLNGAEEWYRRAIDQYQGQGARLGELQSTTRLARLLARTGRQEEGRQRLESLYRWFTEGFERADLQAARIVLDELARSG
jgi:tetratricopeptide (TPR) repeat protein